MNENELQDKLGFIYSGLKELVGNFIPAYISLLVILFLADKIGDVSHVIALLFLAGLIAVGMTAIQPYILNLIIRPSKIIDEYTYSSLDEVMKKKRGEGKKTIDYFETEQKFKKEYELPIKQSIDKFWNKRERLTGEEKKFIEIKESKLFLYLYLFLLFLFITIFSVYENIYGETFLIKIGQISNEFPFVSNYSTIFFLVITIVFFLGLRYEIYRYRDTINDEIPIIAATKDKNNLGYIKEKLQFLKTQRKILDNTVYKYKKEELEKELVRVQKLQFEKDFLKNKVEQLKIISTEEFDEIFKIVGEKTSHPSRFRIIFPNIIAVIFSIIVILFTILSTADFLIDLLSENIFLIIAITSIVALMGSVIPFIFKNIL